MGYIKNSFKLIMRKQIKKGKLNKQSQPQWQMIGCVTTPSQWSSGKYNLKYETSFYISYIGRNSSLTVLTFGKEAEKHKLFLGDCSSQLIQLLRRAFCQYLVQLEKAVAPHSSTLAWKIPWTEEPGRLQSMGSQRVRHD